MFRQAEEEGGAFVQAAFGPGLPAVAGDDLVDDGEADAGAFEFALAVEALEDTEEPADEALVEAESVVTDVDDPADRFLARADLDLGDIAGSAEFERVANEVNEQVPQECRIAVHGRERLDAPLDLATEGFGREIVLRLANDFIERDIGAVHLGAARAR